MSDLDDLLDALDTVHARRQASAVVVTVGGLSAEFWAEDGHDGLAVDLAGDEDLPPGTTLTLAQQRDLRDRGWDDATGMWRRVWPSTPTRAERQAVVYETLTTLDEVYDASGALRIEEVLLPDAPVPAGQSTAIIALVIAAALLAFGIGMVVYVLGA